MEEVELPRMGRLQSRLLIIEAFASILLAQAALALFPFEKLTWWFNRVPASAQLSGAERQAAIKGVRWAIFYVYRRQLPGCTCFHRAIAAQSMLRRRRVGTTLVYGAASLPGKGLEAHTWVMDGEVGVVGYIVAQKDGYRVLARYPDTL